MARLSKPPIEDPRDGRPQTWGGRGQFEHARVGRTGERSVTIRSEQGADASWMVQVPVEPFVRYRLSGWIKTEEVTKQNGRGALLNLHNRQGVATPAVTGTKDWTRVDVEFETEADDQLQINCLLGGWGNATGQAWYDDVQLELIGRAAPAELKITVHAGQTKEPISKYVYGQFIEHLGRCIYGGIWAEMLEDRKFYFPVTGDYQPYRSLQDTPYPVVGALPWQIVGAAESVTMVSENAFVGAHTPQVAADSGLRQRDLGLLRDRAYQGYIWLKAPSGPAQVDVSLCWGEPDAATAQNTKTVRMEAATGEYQQYPFRFMAGDTTDKGSLEIRVSGNPVLVGTVSLMPADNVHGMRADTLALLSNWIRPSIAGRAEISSAATTGKMGSARAIGDRRGPIPPGPASNTMTSAWMSSCSSADS